MTFDGKISDLRHPAYQRDVDNWAKWRITYEGGSVFVETYLKQLSSRETATDFANRKVISYCAAYAKAAINDIKNAIFQRTCDVNRIEGPDSYKNAIVGRKGGVDLEGSSMDAFVGCKLLPELLPMQRVGVYVDMPKLDGVDAKSNLNKRPYLYHYRVEDILNWKCELTENGSEIVMLLLRDHAYQFDGNLQLPTGYDVRYRYICKDPYTKKITMQFYKECCANEYKSAANPEGYRTMDDGAPIELNLPKIPFVMFELPESLLKDVADLQIALTNIASADLGFICQANYPFYVEQYDPRINPPYLKPPGDMSDGAGTASANVAKNKEFKTGVGQGRAYPKDTDQPGFIHPSSEPLKASMEKQADLKKDIRLLVNLSVANLNPVKMGVESKSAEDRGLENGLAFIGLVLEKGEREIAEHWANYTKVTPATVNYPKTYSIRSEEDRQAEAEGHEKLMSKVPSDKFRREMGKKIADVKLSGSVSNDVLTQIYKEIDNAPAMVSDQAQIHSDWEDGFVTTETASTLRGYDAKKEVDKAAKERAERIKITMEAQGGPQGGGQARGNPDAQSTQKTSSEEKIGKEKRGPSLKTKVDGDE